MERQNEPPPPPYYPDIYENKLVLRLHYFSGVIHTSFGILYFIFSTLLYFRWTSLSPGEYVDCQNQRDENNDFIVCYQTLSEVFFGFSSICFLSGLFTIIAARKRSRLGLLIITLIIIFIGCGPILIGAVIPPFGASDLLVISSNETLFCFLSIFVLIFDYRDEFRARLNHENLNVAAKLNETRVVNRFSISAVLVFVSNGVISIYFYSLSCSFFWLNGNCILFLFLGISGVVCSLLLLIGICLRYKTLILISWGVQFFSLIISLVLHVSGIFNLYLHIFSPTFSLMFCIPYGYVLVDEYWGYRINLTRQQQPDQQPIVQPNQDLEDSLPPDYEAIPHGRPPQGPPPDFPSSSSSEFATSRDKQIYLQRNENPPKLPNFNPSRKNSEINHQPVLDGLEYGASSSADPSVRDHLEKQDKRTYDETLNN